VSTHVAVPQLPPPQDRDGFGSHGGGVAAVGVGDDDVGSDVCQRVISTERDCGVADGVDAVEGFAAEVAQVVDDIGGEQFIELVEAALVEQVPVPGDRLADRPPVFSRQHLTPSGDVPTYDSG
jgi:hypothetical protein